MQFGIVVALQIGGALARIGEEFAQLFIGCFILTSAT